MLYSSAFNQSTDLRVGKQSKLHILLGTSGWKPERKQHFYIRNCIYLGPDHVQTSSTAPYPRHYNTRIHNGQCPIDKKTDN